ncbi:hypothetical protein [Streptomyces griseomycini]|uniref:PASTA domain-containing protein n=1 Tax=Streptomyces griseomycini TaxID=66895 RepID=A0A7W7LW22_9ACTN|nr:hypothetical protein [Streptomyces griseomycini]MBB4897505.1 hypothetical protein [Streptomyces griseomycini]GGP90880.1 hypothetical protein GCM10010266_11910 [Streptomyces griseomycini]GGR13381.1 hypothetical protein GCM10015536_18870 [Streptomyces griseomycini]
MSVTRLLIPVLAAALLASATACGASSEPDASADTPAGSRAAETPRSANPEPVAATMPDVIGGNAGRAHEQMGSGTDVAFKDASGRGRPVDDPAEWRICASRPGPNQQITDYPVVLDVVRVSESCEDAVSQ